MKIGVVQINVGMDKEANIARLDRQVRRLAADGCDIVFLPEMAMALTGKPAALQAAAEAEDGAYVTAMKALAKECGINLHLGSFMERRGDRFLNTSLVFDRQGECIGRYSKLHRFDIDLPDGTAIRESDVVDRGDAITVVDIEGLKVALTICYDLRFPELFRALVDLGADLITVPAAFTFQTGADHWEVLLRARAIETECYIAAPGQVGGFDDGKYLNFGHSMIIDPWGTVVGQASNGEGVASAVIDRDYIQTVRARIPLRKHRVLPLA
ncbi:Nitrilase/cyanide hydratase and apolipoprotein N-acyltransferase [Rhizorhabdus wittichii RW1]|uniref:Nitrilase/cyanide hydratase and apolipoprotein N-acyltransferase n=1 Tax=Rhizorhabdus wittichii (strain DSM 6014 / CCUG 31198 / JCM 15750 / NBRC 105917 / EY 4224 / RW1) TaxID=392499 RepID=A0A9J9HC46_RHIWR|nr:Nitrilase/cyanide hydratase and apolipoprotein N-acyltransferase [Rhizorhabdus wittichii RW1]